MKYCKKCVMPDTRPGITFDEHGVCSACRHYETRETVDWEQRFQEFEKYCDKYRNCNGKGQYDCAVAVSGGKDSHYQVYVLKEIMHMHPILFTVEENFPMTRAGMHNIKNISEEFGCTIISCKPNIKAQKALMRKFFEKNGTPNWYTNRLAYTFPLSIALKFHTPMICYGENVSYEYGGVEDEEVYSAIRQIENGVAIGFPKEELLIDGVEEDDILFVSGPSKDELKQIDPFYLSYFLPWNSYKNYKFAQSRGFHDLSHEWDRSFCIENFDEVDSAVIMVHAWLKYPKYGHAVATDYASRWIRYGMMNRETAIQLVKKHDHALDTRCVREFCDFCDYSESEFWRIVDSLYNTDIFYKNKFGEWVLKQPIWDEIR